MGGLEKVIKKSILNLGEMGLHKGGGKVNWFPGHMASATRAIRDRLKLTDLVIEVRDARIPLSSMNQDLQPMLAGKRRVIALNKKDLANANIMKKWKAYFDSGKQDCLAINAHSRSSVHQLLNLTEFKLREVISREPTLLIMVVGVPNVGKSALINSISQIASSRFQSQGKTKRATVGPLPGVTQDIAGFKIAHQPSIYVLDSPGVLVPSISDVETGLKLALTGSVKDSVVGEERIAEYLLAVLNTRGIPFHWKDMLNTVAEGGRAKYVDGPNYNLKNLLPNWKPTPDKSGGPHVEDMVTRVQRALYSSLSEFDGSMEDEDDLESLIYKQFEVLQKAFKIAQKESEARLMVAKRLLALFRSGKLGPFLLDDVPDAL